MNDQFFEMLWDCEQCDARQLLAKSQRHCPTCGAAQDPQRRYFPQYGQEVEAKGHQYVGIDWICTYCESPSSAAAAFCANCGGPKEGATNVTLVRDDANSAAEPGQSLDAPLAPRATHAEASKPAEFTSPNSDAHSNSPISPWLLAIPALIVVLIVITLSTLVYSLFSKHDESVRLVEKSWSRSVDVEHFTSVKDYSWCDALPADAYQVTRTSERRSTRQVADGEVCVDTRADMGDGTFTKRRECSPRYREEPVFDSRCHYRINRWQLLRTDRSVGGAELAPTWPSAEMVYTKDPGTTLGAQRSGSRHEAYRIRLQSAKGDAWTCDVQPEVWSRLTENQTMSIKVRGTGGADCDSLVSKS